MAYWRDVYQMKWLIFLPNSFSTHDSLSEMKTKSKWMGTFIIWKEGVWKAYIDNPVNFFN